jgi:Tfp pilus assembly protein PilX
MVTALGLLMLAVLTLLGTTAVVVTSTDIQIGGNYKASETAFYAAEAGVEEARARLRLNAGGALIADTHPTSTQWRAYIGDATKAQAKGYDSGLSQHSRTDSLQSAMNYIVTIRHKPHPSDSNKVLYWGDDDGDGVNTQNPTTGRNIYVVTSTGYGTTASQTVEVEMAKIPPITVPGALYVEAYTTIQGSSTYVIGTDKCGSDNQPGIRTTLGPGNVQENGNPTIVGTPRIAYGATNMDVQTIVDTLKEHATHTYAVTSATHSGMNWGTPTPGATLQDPSSCSVQNVVRYTTNNTYIRLTGGSSGCGILLVEGDLDVHGSFSWYGPVIVTGSVTLTGGGNKNITGALLAGGSADADLVGGNANIVYCSPAVKNQTENLPLKSLSWREPEGI